MTTQPDYWRQLDILDPEALDVPIVVIGAGGIGSPTALALAKMGCHDLTIYDPDIVEAHNLPNQMYRLLDIGRPKAQALRDLITMFAGDVVHDYDVAVSGQALNGIVVAAVDTMNTRRDVWERGVRYQSGVRLFIDARMGGEVCRIYSIHPSDPDDIRFYEATLYGDDEATEQECTAQAIIYNVFAIAALIANQVKKEVSAEPLFREVVFDLYTLTLLTRD
jgi:molybdopterin/thiamine biosynthesis adenylyltransferase